MFHCIKGLQRIDEDRLRGSERHQFAIPSGSVGPGIRLQQLPTPQRRGTLLMVRRSNQTENTSHWPPSRASGQLPIYRNITMDKVGRAWEATHGKPRTGSHQQSPKWRSPGTDDPFSRTNKLQVGREGSPEFKEDKKR